MKQLLLATLALALLAGCATSTVASRRKERSAAYAGLTPEFKRLVDEGQIKAGMPEDAVFIALGTPAQIIHSGDASGESTTWLYWGGYMQATRYWAYREVGRGDDLCLERYLVTDYQPQTYVRAEIVFVNGHVARWRTLPQPPST